MTLRFWLAGAWAALPLIAQISPLRVEIGVHTVPMYQPALGENPLGLGGNFTLRLARYVSFDAAVTRAPVGGAGANFPLTRGLFGVRAGSVAFANIGVYGKARAGFAAYDETAYKPGPGTKPAVDLGLVLVFFSEKHFGLRFDFEETIIFYGHQPFASPTGILRPGARGGFTGAFGVFAHF